MYAFKKQAFCLKLWTELSSTAQSYASTLFRIKIAVFWRVDKKLTVMVLTDEELELMHRGQSKFKIFGGNTVLKVAA